MKKKLLFLLLTVSLFQISTYSWGNEQSSKRKIELKRKLSDQHRSIPISPEAFIEGPLLSIEYPFTVISAIITLKNADTNDIVYLSTDLNVDKINIDLAGEKSGKYTLEIQLSESTFVGDFET